MDRLYVDPMSDPYDPIPAGGGHPAPANIGSSNVGHGDGAPGASTPLDRAYVDDLTGDFYVNINGTWQLASAGGGGTPEIFGGSVDPNGSETATGPAIYLRSADVNGDRRIYSKPTGSSGNTGWEEVLTYQA